MNNKPTTMQELDERLASRQREVDERLRARFGGGSETGSPRAAEGDATPSASADPAPEPATSSPSPAVSHRFPRKGLWGAIAGGVALVVALVAFLLFRSTSQKKLPELTIAEYRDNLIQSVNLELEAPTSELCMLIENAKATAKLISATVTKCEVETLDGSDRILQDGSNASVTMELKCEWQDKSDTNKSDITTLQIIRRGNNQIEINEIKESLWKRAWKGTGKIAMRLAEVFVAEAAKTTVEHAFSSQ